MQTRGQYAGLTDDEIAEWRLIRREWKMENEATTPFLDNVIVDPFIKGLIDAAHEAIGDGGNDATWDTRYAVARRLIIDRLDELFFDRFYDLERDSAEGQS